MLMPDGGTRHQPYHNSESYLTPALLVCPATVYWPTGETASPVTGRAPAEARAQYELRVVAESGLSTPQSLAVAHPAMLSQWQVVGQGPLRWLSRPKGLSAYGNIISKLKRYLPLCLTFLMSLKLTFKLKDHFK